jgi:radical SAM protein with 4Fe4S-binding SPASM domain
MQLYNRFISEARKGPSCILPFNQLVIDANGDCFPCQALRGKPEYNMGNIFNNSFNDIWNGENIKSFRKKMIENKRSEKCDFYCHRDYEVSCKSLNPIHFFPKFIKNINRINNDGSVDYKPSIFFLKTSNICNLSCQYCKSDSSTTWSMINNKLFNHNYSIVKKDAINDKLIQTIIDNSDDLECLYFSGGEPSLVPSYSRMLEKLLDKKGKYINVASASNISILNKSSIKFFNLLNQFDSSMLFCSIDATDDTNDFIRMNSSFSETEKTFTYIKNNFKNINVYINSVISIFNALDIFNFHKSWYEKNLLEIDDFRYVLCQSPKIFNLLYLSDDLRNKIINSFNNYIQWLKQNEKQNDDYPNNGIRNYVYLKKYVVDMLTNEFPDITDFIDTRKKQRDYLLKINAHYKLPESLFYLKEEFNRPVLRINKKLIYVNA